MEIYPRLQAQMLLFALALGLAAGLWRQLLLALRCVLGAHLPPERMRARYERPLPLLRRAVGFPARRARRGWCAAVAFGTDLVFCLVAALALLILLYDYNDGAWRLSVPVLFLLGFSLFRLFTARIFAHLNDDFAYGLAVLLLYVRALLCLPVRSAWRLVRRFLLCPARRGIRALCLRQYKRRSERLCRAQLALAGQGLITKERKMSNVKKEGHAAAMDHPDPDRGAVLHRAGRGVRAAARMERAGKAERGAGKAKGRDRAANGISSV
jgi:hypothetical protein